MRRLLGGCYSGIAGCSIDTATCSCKRSIDTATVTCSCKRCSVLAGVLHVALDSLDLTTTSAHAVGSVSTPSGIPPPRRAAIMAERFAGEPLVQRCTAVAGAAEHWRNNCSACSAVAESLPKRVVNRSNLCMFYRSQTIAKGAGGNGLLLLVRISHQTAGWGFGMLILALRRSCACAASDHHGQRQLRKLLVHHRRVFRHGREHLRRVLRDRDQRCAV